MWCGVIYLILVHGTLVPWREKVLQKPQRRKLLRDLAIGEFSRRYNVYFLYCYYFYCKNQCFFCKKSQTSNANKLSQSKIFCEQFLIQVFPFFSYSTLDVTCYNIHRRKHRRDSVQPPLYLSIWIITKFRGVCLVLYLIMKCYKMFLHSVFQIPQSTWSAPLRDKFKSKERFCDMSVADIQQKIELTGSMSWTLRPLCHLYCKNCRMCSLFSPVPAVPRLGIRELSFRSSWLCLWGPLSWSLVLQLVLPRQASSESATKKSPSKLQPLSLQTFFPTLWGAHSNRILRDADRSRFTHSMVTAGLLRSICPERRTCSVQASEYGLSPAECNADTTVWWHIALILEIKVNRM